MRIQHNIMAMNAYRNYTNNVNAMKKNLEKLSSGYKINRAGDDAAGLAISEKMRAQITGLQQAQNNAKSGINLVQTAEGALTEVHDMLNRMVKLADQSANGTYDNTTDRTQLQKEVNQLLDEINRIADSSNFNGINLLDGTLGLDSAYTIENVDSVDAEPVSGFVTNILPTAASPVVPTNTILHADGKDAKAGEFTIDLQQVTVSKDTAATPAASKFKLKIGGVAVATLTAASAGALDGKKMAELIVAKFKGTKTTNSLMIKNADGSFAAGAAGNGNLYLAATDNGDGTVTFKVNAYTTKGGTYTAITSNNLKEAMDAAGSKAGGKVLGVAVEVISNGKGTVTRGENVGTLDIINNQQASASKLGNTVMDIDLTKVTDGAVISIAGEKYTFAIGKDSAYKGGDNVIDLTDIVTDKSDLKTTTTAQQSAIMAKITDATAENKTLHVGFNGTWNKLTLTEKSTGEGKSADSVTEAMKKAMSTANGFKGLVSLTSAEQKAGQSVSGTPKDDTSLTIGGQRFTFNKAGEGKDPNAVYIKTADGMQGLSDALKAEGIAHEFANGKITVRGGSILGKGLTLQIGDTSDAFNQLNVAVQDMHTKTLGIGGLDISTEEKAQLAVDKIKAAINTVSDVRGTLGATQNRLDHTINNLSVMTENIQDAESTIRDTDVADEMMAYTKNNILIQSAQAMLAQANQVPQGVLQLLQ